MILDLRLGIRIDLLSNKKGVYMSDEQRRHLEHLERELAPLISPSCMPDAYEHCITCSDAAVQGRVISFDQATFQATVAIGDSTAEVDTMLIDELAPGDSILIHGGVALAKL